MAAAESYLVAFFSHGHLDLVFQQASKMTLHFWTTDFNLLYQRLAFLQ